MLILSPPRTLEIHIINICISNTLLSVLSALFFGQRSVGCLAYKALQPRCRQLLSWRRRWLRCQREQRSRLYGHMPPLAIRCCSVWQENRSSVLRLPRAKKKNTEEVNPRSETKLKSENVVNYKKLLRYFVDFLRVCCQVLNETVNIKLIACQTSRLACLPCYQLYNTIIPVRPATTYIN